MRMYRALLRPQLANSPVAASHHFLLFLPRVTRDDLKDPFTNGILFRHSRCDALGEQDDDAW